MEMNKSSKNMNPLQQAKQEYEQFKSAQSKLPAPEKARAVPAQPQHAEKLLLCATYQGFASQMICKISSEIVEITDVRKLAQQRVFITHGDGNETPDGYVFQKRKLELGAFTHCPHCDSTGLVHCSKCQSISCIGPDRQKHRCPACGYTARLEFNGISVDVAVSAERPRTAVNAPETSGRLRFEKALAEAQQRLLGHDKRLTLPKPGKF
jgi:hypothetical protein